MTSASHGEVSLGISNLRLEPPPPSIWGDQIIHVGVGGWGGSLSNFRFTNYLKNQKALILG